MWCDRRLMSDSPKAQYGIPEVNLGMFPGWGGTARAPRMVGLSNAVELISSGDSINGGAATQMGQATESVPSEKLQQAAIDLVRVEQKTGG